MPSVSHLIIFYVLIGYASTITLPDYSHQKQAVKCIYEAVSRSFKSQTLIVVLTDDDVDSLGHELQTSLLLSLHSEYNWFVQVTNGEMNNFTSIKKCVKDGDKEICKNFFQPLKKADCYIILTDSPRKLEIGLSKLKVMKNYKMRAIFFIYYFKISERPIATATSLLMILYRAYNYRSVVLLPSTNEDFELYGLDLFGEDTIKCGYSPKIFKINECNRNGYINDNFRLTSDFNNLKNCSMKVITLRMPPFVFNENMGLEIIILRELQRRINFSVDFLKGSSHEEWGNKTYGNLELIYDKPFYMGVGSVSQNEQNINDFDYSDNYFTDRMIWVVPSARQIPQWKVILIIFQYTLWIVLVVMLVTYGCLIYFVSITRKGEYQYLKLIGAGMIMSLQLMIGTTARRQPKSKLVRLLFMSLALFQIILGCCYQSSLIDVLTNPPYEHQIHDFDEVSASGLKVGGKLSFRSVFYDPLNNDSMKIYNMYQVNEANNTMRYWLNIVSEKRDTMTVMGEFFVKFLQTIRYTDITNSDLTSKVHIVPEVMFSFPIRMVFARGFPLRGTFNKVIQGLIHSGLIAKWANSYLESVKKENYDFYDSEERTENNNDGAIVITIDHMVGTFALLAFGYLFGMVFFIIEISVFYFSKSKLDLCNVTRNCKRKIRNQNKFISVSTQTDVMYNN